MFPSTRVSVEVCTAWGNLGELLSSAAAEIPPSSAPHFGKPSLLACVMGDYVLGREFGADSGESPSMRAGKATSPELGSTWLCLPEPSRRSSCNCGEVQGRRQPCCLTWRGKKRVLNQRLSSAFPCWPLLCSVALLSPLSYPGGSWQPCLL